MASPAQSFGDFAASYAKETPAKPSQSFSDFAGKFEEPGVVARGLEAAYQTVSKLPEGLLNMIRPGIMDFGDMLQNSSPEDVKALAKKVHDSMHGPDFKTDVSPTPEIVGNLGGLGVNAAITAGMFYGLHKGWSKASELSAGADPALDLIKTYKPRDARFKERVPGAIADIKQAAGANITGNEHLASVSPEEMVTPAFKQNRVAWDRYFAPAEERGVQAHGKQIIDATEESLKGSLSAEQRTAIMDEAVKRYGRNIGVRELQEMLNEKNGELQPFYSKNDAVRSAAEQGGAITGRSQALLEAQGKAIRNTLYEALDPENKGAGPREIQRRYGAIRMLSNEANDARNAIEGEKAGTPAGKAAKTVLAGLDVLTAPLREGGLTEGFLKVPQQFRGSADPMIARAFRNAPEFQPYPEPAPSGRLKVLQTGRAPLELPPATAPVDTSLGSSHGDLIRPGTMSREELARMDRVEPIQEANLRGTPVESKAVDHDIPERVARVADARQRVATTLTGKPYSSLSNSERVRVDELLNEGYGFAAQPGEAAGHPPAPPTFQPSNEPKPPAAAPPKPPQPAPTATPATPDAKRTRQEMLKLKDITGGGVSNLKEHYAQALGGKAYKDLTAFEQVMIDNALKRMK